MKKIFFCVLCLGYTLHGHAMLRGILSGVQRATGVRTIFHDYYDVSNAALYAAKEVETLKAQVQKLQQDRGSLARILRSSRYKTRRDVHAIWLKINRLDTKVSDLTI